MKKIFFLFAAAGSLFISAQEATKKAVQESVTSSNKEVEEVEEISAAENMEKRLDEWAESRGITFGQVDAKGRMYQKAYCAVSANVISANFIKSRSMAFEKAYMDAISTLVMDSVGTQMTKQLRIYLDDQSDNKLEQPKNLSQAQNLIIKKIGALAEAQLDKALRKSGVDPKEIEGKSVVAKKKLFQDSLIKQSVKQAIGDASGIVPINTFETYDAKGNYAIGVVVRSDFYSKEIGKCIARRERPAISGKGKALKLLIPKDPKKLMTQFGVRIVYDETGTPALISYGQWGSSYTGNNARMAQRAMTTAKMQAQSIADEALTNFIRSRIAIKETSEKGENESSAAMFKADGSTTVEDTAKVIDKVFRSAKMEGFDAMSGRSTIKSTVLKHPSGHKIAVVVRVWTFSVHENNQALLKHQKKNEQKVKRPTIKPEGGDGFRQGEDYDF